MYLAMNRFTVKPENAEAFEQVWLSRDTHLKEMEGFVEFHMLKGPEREDGTILYASHTVWKNEESFRAWTRSEQFRASHAKTGGGKLFEGHPNFEGFASFQNIA
ncbi:MAG: antibiotic biosynthesis monooxygenase [Vannielia sp.]|uniref:antibiotic biosynthesis monooxygenase family protein n=1 Tax=Rhodobacterales TaxID=204455 RepID=UPI0020961336|nr:antibiotic biosynthesis monooxygenase [Oceanicola sp. 502str15]MCO6384659.1 antibiotic biosynthesis monooxygenase [Oceanicola sp. 502str15]